MANHFRGIVCLLLAAMVQLPAQQVVHPRSRYERVICVVPMVGAGTYADPRRPLFAPTPDQLRSQQLLGFSFQPSDDGNFAIVEFVARDAKAFTSILADARLLKKFEKGKVKRDDLEKELKLFRKDFDLNRFGVNAQ